MSSLYEKRGIFYYQGKDEDGNRIQKSLRTRDRAEAEEQKEKLDERFSTNTPPTLSKLVEDYLEHRRRKRDRDELSDRTGGRSRSRLRSACRRDAPFRSQPLIRIIMANLLPSKLDNQLGISSPHREKSL